MIEKLTHEQELMLHKYKEEAIEIALDLTPINVEKAVKAIQKYIGFDGQTVIVYPSPLAAILARQAEPEKDQINMNNAFSAQSDIDWVTFYRFFRNEVGLTKGTEGIPAAWEAAISAHWYWASSTEIILVEKPVEMHLQVTGTKLTDEKTGKSIPLRVLHSTDGMAIRYADNTGLYAIAGITLPEEYEYIVKDWKKLKPKDLLEIENAEIRQAAIKSFGADVYSILPHTILDNYVSEKGGIYALYEVKYEDGVNRLFLKGACPSKGDDFFEPVHPEARTCKQALNWREPGTLDTDYIEPIART